MSAPAPLKTAIRADPPGGEVPWRDNAFVSFWDPAREAFGTLHVSTSPRAEGRRARLSLSVRGSTAEVIEPLGPGTFRSPSLGFDLESGSIDASTDELDVRLETDARFAPADFTQGEVIPEMGDEPLRHFQTTVRVSGSCRVGEAEVAFDGTGIRDRTWGPRDESVGISEYAWFFIGFDAFSVTAMRFLGAEGFDRTDGFVLSEDGAERIESLAITRDASGLCA